jgi:DNA-binding LacI/PurR family transcriptional regulator
MSHCDKRNKATLKEVAKVAGVSPITVSRFVNTPDLVSVGARGKIIAAIEQTGYIPNAAARQLKTSQSDIVFFVVPNIRNELYATLSHELMLRLSAINKSLFICDYNFQDKLEQMLMQEIFKHRPAAIVMAAGDGMSNGQLQLLNSSKIPVIQFDRVNEAISSVANIQLDNYSGGVLAAQYLLEKKVKKAVVFTGNTRRVLSTRVDGFNDVFSQVGIDVEMLEFDLHNNKFEDLHHFDVSGDTGYFLLNSDIANTFLLTNRNKLTQTLADRIVVFDGVTNGGFLPFALTTVDYNYASFVDHIVESLASIFEQPLPLESDIVIPVVIKSK